MWGPSMQLVFNWRYFSTLTAILSFSLIISAEAKAATPDNSQAKNSLMLSGHSVFQTAMQLETDASIAIRRSNKIRKDVKALRVKLRKIKDEKFNEEYKSVISDLTGQIEYWQEAGAAMRERSSILKQNGLQVMTSGFVQQWADSITNLSPMSLQSKSALSLAHNAQVRSVHPNMPEPIPASVAKRNSPDGMSLQLPALTGQQAPDELYVGTFQISRDLKYFAHIEVESTSDKNLDLVPLNEIHKWLLFITDPAGNPVTGATITLDGHMPGHVHGLPTKPEITDEVAPGVYRLSGVKFQMDGWWVMQFNIANNGIEDSVIFNLLL